jgi:hypothetical protein
MNIGRLAGPALRSRLLYPARKISSAILAGLGIGAILVGSSVDADAVIVHRGATARGPHGGVYHRGTTVARPGYHGGGVYRSGGVYHGGGYHGGGYARWGGWARPAYRWGPGGAIAAGAAIGFVAAATAATWAGPAPGPGLCWYYTDPGRTQGFWDACP